MSFYEKEKLLSKLVQLGAKKKKHLSWIKKVLSAFGS